jgi:hypothetical protein
MVILKSRNVSVEWLAVLLHFHEVTGSNLDPDVGYPDEFSVVLIGLLSKQLTV